MIWLFYILNLAISAFNAWSVGKAWVEAKAAGGGGQTAGLGKIVKHPVSLQLHG